MGEITPQAESCDGLDNDCDGELEKQGEMCLSEPGCHQGNCKCAQDALGNYRCFLD